MKFWNLKLTWFWRVNRKNNCYNIVAFLNSFLGNRSIAREPRTLCITLYLKIGNERHTSKSRWPSESDGGRHIRLQTVWRMTRARPAEMRNLKQFRRTDRLWRDCNRRRLCYLSLLLSWKPLLKSTFQSKLIHRSCHLSIFNFWLFMFSVF